jgi:putative copper resistance protein D
MTRYLNRIDRRLPVSKRPIFAVRSTDIVTAAMLPPLNWHRFTQFTFDPVPTVMIILVALAYLAGVKRLSRGEPEERWHVRRTLAFFAGLVTTFVAVESFIGIYDSVLFYDHMIQHLLLIMVAGPLFAMGAPIELLERATTGRAHEVIKRALDSRVSEVIGHPIFGFVLYAVVIPVTHLTSFYNLTLENETVHNMEHFLYLVVGYLFWRPVVAIEPSRHRLHPGFRLLYISAGVPVDTFTGLALTATAHEIFPAYKAMHRTWGPSLVTDLHIGGAIMWVGGDTIMLLAMIPVAIVWIHHEERLAEEADRILDEAALVDSNSRDGSAAGP